MVSSWYPTAFRVLLAMTWRSPQIITDPLPKLSNDVTGSRMFTIMAPVSSMFVICAQCKPALICEENGAPIVDLLILMFCGTWMDGWKCLQGQLDVLLPSSKAIKTNMTWMTENLQAQLCMFLARTRVHWRRLLVTVTFDPFSSGAMATGWMWSLTTASQPSTTSWSLQSQPRGTSSGAPCWRKPMPSECCCILELED